MVKLVDLIKGHVPQVEYDPGADFQQVQECGNGWQRISMRFDEEFVISVFVKGENLTPEDVPRILEKYWIGLTEEQKENMRPTPYIQTR